MKKPLKDIEKKVNDLLHAELTTEDKAWDIIFEFYHHVLTRMEEQNMTQADLARKLGKSRSAISQLLNKTPNISVIRMVEIADAVGLEFSLTPIKSKRVQQFRTSYIPEHPKRVTSRMEVNEK
ncbi:MAG: helix-turn-helix transcriptional regulator [Candidatus Marinimicrobia bacterium]|nr:helix-turn-helix transcriptional regulator [Candidatus Neomarinimicrobiota bacterium]